MTAFGEFPLTALLTGIETEGSSAILDASITQFQASGLIGADDATLARRLRQSLIQGRHRQRLLGVLLESATDLAAITDLGDVLQAIVRRTRTLLGSDMAYISLNDYDTEETYIHTTDGVITAGYRDIRMKLGSGVLGKIAGGAKSSQSLDYIKDPEFIHVAEIDRTVESEGVRSIMGAPLRRDGALLGALLVAERYPRHFTDEEMWLVESISSLASVALQNARLIGDLKQAIDERDLLQLASAREHRAQTLSQQLDRELTEFVVSDDPFGSFLQKISLAWNVNAWIIDSGGKPLHGPIEIPIDPRALAKALLDSEQMAETHAFSAEKYVDGLSPEAYCLMAARAGDRLLGAVLVHGELDADARRTLSRSGVIVSVMLLMDETRYESDIRTQSELLRLLLDEVDPHLAAVLQRTARFGIRAGSALTVHVIGCDGQEPQALNLLRTITTSSTGIIALHDAAIVLVSPNNLAAEAIELLAVSGITATIGTDSIPSLVSCLRSSYTTAKRSMHALLALGRTGSIGDRQSLGMVGFLMHAATPDEIEEIVRGALDPILQSESVKRDKLIDTLWTYYESDRHIAKTAEQLHIHANTLRQRLDRIGSLLGPEWTNQDRSTQIYLALQLRRLQKRVL